MNQADKLNLVKLIHTFIWVFFNVVIFYVAYAVIVDRVDIYVWIGVGLVFAEGVLLALNKLRCPLTNIAEQYTDSKEDNFDIYLPNWLAKHTKIIYTSIFTACIFGLLYRVLA